MNIGERIKDLRIDKGISRAKLAKAIDVTVRTISYWENGVNEPKATYIVRLAEFFGVTGDYLLGCKTKKNEHMFGLLR